MAIEKIELIDPGGNFTVEYGIATIRFTKTKHEGNWEAYLSDADKLIKKWDIEYNAMGIASLLGAICIRLKEREDGKQS